MRLSGLVLALSEWSEAASGLSRTLSEPGRRTEDGTLRTQTCHATPRQAQAIETETGRVEGREGREGNKGKREKVGPGEHTYSVPLRSDERGCARSRRPPT